MQNKRKIEGGFGTQKGFSGNTYTDIIIIVSRRVCINVFSFYLDPNKGFPNRGDMILNVPIGLI